MALDVIKRKVLDLTQKLKEAEERNETLQKQLEEERRANELVTAQGLQIIDEFTC